MHAIIEIFNEGGAFMFAILFLSLYSLAMIIRKIYFLWFKYRLAEDEVAKAIIKQIEANNYARAIQYCSSKAHPLTNILKAGLVRANRSEKEIRRAIEVAASEELPDFKSGLSFLPHFSNISTMMGLLGTIRGLIMAFSGMSGGDAVKRQEALSSGIAIAFRATFFALSVAAVLVFFFVILSNKQGKMMEKMDHVITTIVDVLVTKNTKMLNSQKGG